MKRASTGFLEYLRSVRNSSPHTVTNYGRDLAQFLAYLTPPGTEPPALSKITHQIIREYVGYLHEQGLQKSSVARKLATLRSFFKYCVREGLLKENPGRLVPTPKLPKRIPSVISAEEMSGFLDQLGGASKTGKPKESQEQPTHAAPSGLAKLVEDSLMVPRYRATLELLYAAGVNAFCKNMDWWLATRKCATVSESYT